MRFGGDTKEVYFDVWCPNCKWYTVPEVVIEEDGATSKDTTPCHECLNEPSNEYSHKPIKFESVDEA